MTQFIKIQLDLTRKILVLETIKNVQNRIVLKIVFFGVRLHKLKTNNKSIFDKLSRIFFDGI
jgi:hypothetical protein